eukprot:195821-Rhodomonas_salina.5
MSRVTALFLSSSSLAMLQKHLPAISLHSPVQQQCLYTNANTVARCLIATISSQAAPTETGVCWYQEYVAVVTRVYRDAVDRAWSVTLPTIAYAYRHSKTDDTVLRAPSYLCQEAMKNQPTAAAIGRSASFYAGSAAISDASAAIYSGSVDVYGAAAAVCGSKTHLHGSAATFDRRACSH